MDLSQLGFGVCKVFPPGTVLPPAVGHQGTGEGRDGGGRGHPENAKQVGDSLLYCNKRRI